ncbi:LytTR family transcriptional regulator [bacterium SCSIO 12741]|nr:LytTR family transcriptional regulator [bacterium SCSIO 12741]
MQPYSLALIGISDQAFSPIHPLWTDPSIRIARSFEDPYSFMQDKNLEHSFTLLVIDERAWETLQTHFSDSLASYQNRTIVATSNQSRFSQNHKSQNILTINKPINPEKLFALVLALIQPLRHVPLQSPAEQLVMAGFNDRGQGVQKVALGDQKSVHFIDLNDIICFQASSNYTTARLKEGQSITTSRTLMHYERLLKNHGFIRVHRSHLINSRHIKQLIKATNTLVLSEDLRVEIASDRRSQLLQAVGIPS